MKSLLLLLLLPLITKAQLTGREDDSLRKIADTMHFARPFQFETTCATTLNEQQLFDKSYAWLGSVKDSLSGIALVKDQRRKKITATNVPATADISCTLVITVSKSNYHCVLSNYVFHSINGKRLPVDQAALMKDYANTVKIEKVLISKNYETIFLSLASKVNGKPIK